MDFITNRKRAVGTGSAGSGTTEHWFMTQTSVALLILVPLFLFTFGRILGSSHEEVLAYYQRPFPAIIAALTIVVGFVHFRAGARVAIEDYTRGTTRKMLLLATTCLSYAAIATALFALVRLAL